MTGTTVRVLDFLTSAGSLLDPFEGRVQRFRYVKSIRFGSYEMRFWFIVARRLTVDVSCSFLHREFDDKDNSDDDHNNTSGDTGRSCSVYGRPKKEQEARRRKLCGPHTCNG
jgi:hypothetical protein